MSEPKSNRLPTPEGILSYPKVFVPVLGKNAFPGAKPAYSTAILFTAAAVNTPEMKVIVQTVFDLAKTTYGDAVTDVLAANVAAFKQAVAGVVDPGTSALTRVAAIKLPFRFDVKAAGYPDRIVMYFSAATNDNPNYPKPDVLKVIGEKKAASIADPREIYPGVFAKISVNPFVRQVDTNKGISLALGAVMKTRDCEENERLVGGSGGGASDFGMEEDAAPAGGTTSAELDGLFS
jgi:hypothetical protein